MHKAKAATNFLFVLGMVAAFACPKAQTPPQQAPPAPVNPPKYNGVVPFKFEFFNQKRRLALLSEMQNYFTENYVGAFLKDGLSKDILAPGDHYALQILAGAIKAENDSIDPTPLIETMSTTDPDYDLAVLVNSRENLKFFDRLRIGLAKFQDSHIIFNITTPLPFVGLGLDFVLIDKKLYANQDLRVDRFSISRGDELVSIDGEPAFEAISKLLVFINSNSDGSRNESAVQALSFRDFKFPSKAMADLILKNKNGTKYSGQLAWQQKTRTLRPDVIEHFKDTKITRLLQGGQRETVLEGKRFWDGNPDAYREAYSVQLDDFNNYNSETKPTDLALRGGTWTHKGKTYGVLQIFSFAYEQLEDGDSFIPVISKYLNKFKAAGYPLIIDVRQNEGGRSDLVMDLVRTLLKKEDSVPPPGLAFRMVFSTSSVFDRIASPEVDPDTEIYGISVSEVLDKLNQLSAADRVSKNGESRYTPVVNGQALTANPDSFDGPIVVMTGPLCRSVCEVFVRLMGYAHNPERPAARALVMGGPTQGTGFGYFDDYDVLKELTLIFRESSNHFTVKLPNFLSTEIPNLADQIRWGQAVVETTSAENLPFMPKVPYSRQLKDLMENDAGWFEKAAELLNPGSAHLNDIH